MSSTELQIGISDSFAAYLAHGARSTQKLIPLHRTIATQIGRILSRENDIYSVGLSDVSHDGEVKVLGSFYEKNIDVTVVNGGTKKLGKKSIKLLADSTVEFCIGIKFITSNYKQNINNYFEGMLGETVNVQTKGIPYGQLLVLPEKIPYFKKNGEIGRWEDVSENDLKKYLNLVTGISGPHKPAFVAIKLVRIEEDKSVTILDDSCLELLLPGATSNLTWNHALDIICEKIG